MGFLTGKTVIITGAGRATLSDGSCGSIGYGIATAYAKEGANIVITGRNVKKLEDAKNELESLYGKIDGLLKMEIIIEKLDSSSGDIMMDSEFTDNDALKAYFAKNAKALLDKGVEIKQVNGLKTLFSIAPADGSYKVNFGEAEFEAFFKSFLRPQMVEMLF